MALLFFSVFSFVPPHSSQSFHKNPQPSFHKPTTTHKKSPLLPRLKQQLTMCNTSTLLLVTLLATVLSTFPSPTTAQVGSSPWCQSYMANCEDLRKLNCDAKVPDNDRSMSWISVHCSTVTPSTGACKYFSPDCSCSYSDVANWNQTVWVPLGQPALERTQARKFCSSLWFDCGFGWFVI